MNNYEWLQNIASVRENHWHNDSVIRYWDIPNYAFYDTEKRYTTYIKPIDIKGIDYAYEYNCFSDITWLQLLNQLKRFKDVRKKNSSLEELTDHAHNDYNEQKAVMKYGETLITTTGQHRLALAKFLEIPSIKVYVVEHIFNHDRYAKYLKRKVYIKRFKSLGLLHDEFVVDYNNCTDSRLILDIFENHCTVHEQAFDLFLTYYEGIKVDGFFAKLLVKIEELTKSYNEYNLRIEDKSFLNSVRHLIRKHKLKMIA